MALRGPVYNQTGHGTRPGPHYSRPLTLRRVGLVGLGAMVALSPALAARVGAQTAALHAATLHSATLIANGPGGCLAAADLTGDGAADLVTGMASAEVHAAPNWTLAGTAPLAGPLEACATGDVDSDGRPEVIGIVAGRLVTAAADAGGWTVTDLGGAAGASGPVAIADLDGSGGPEIVTASPAGVRAWYGSGSTWADFVLSPTPGNGNGHGHVGAGDLDGDGDLDLVTAAAALVNPGPSTALTTAWAAVPLPGNGAFSVADIDGDGRANWLGQLSNGQVVASTLIDPSTGAWQTEALGHSSGAVAAVIATDVDGDGRRDVAFGTSDGVLVTHHTVAGWEGVGPGGPAVLPDAMVAVDLNGDGAREVIVGSPSAVTALRFANLTPADGAGPPATSIAIPPGTPTADVGSGPLPPPVVTAVGVTPTPTTANRGNRNSGGGGGPTNPNGGPDESPTGEPGTTDTTAGATPAAGDPALGADVALSADPPIGVTATASPVPSQPIEPIGLDAAPSQRNPASDEVAVAGQVLSRDGIASLRTPESTPGRGMWSGLAAVFVVAGGGVVLTCQALLRRYYGDYFIRD